MKISNIREFYDNHSVDELLEMFRKKVIAQAGVPKDLLGDVGSMGLTEYQQSRFEEIVRQARMVIYDDAEFN